MKHTKLLLFLLSLVILPNVVLAHDVVKDIANISKAEIAFTYFKIGFEHILPLGFDHILFIVSLVLFGPKLKPLLWQSAAFTMGHCITLILASLNILKVSPSIVEPIIALTIIYVAIENIFSTKIKPSRIVLIFTFGLLHGLGFATALAEIGLPKSAFLTSIFLFNIGLEFGQITVILFSFLILTNIQKLNNIAWSKITTPISILIICVSCYWVYERIFI